MHDAVFAALADPTRRHIYTTLARRGPSTATAIASDMAITRQAVAKHLAVLADAGMASSTRSGRETRFAADVGPLDDLQAWIEQVEHDWSKRLRMLAESLARGTGQRSPGVGNSGS